MSERWGVLDKNGEMWGRFFDDAEQVALYMLDFEEEYPDVAPFTVTRIYIQAELDAAVAAEREAAMADKRRLDWLADPKNNVGQVMLPREIVERNIHSLRDAIDEAMKPN